MPEHTTAEKLEWLESELYDRRRNYPDMIKKNQITQKMAKKKIAIMEAMVEDYQRRLSAQDELPLDGKVA